VAGIANSTPERKGPRLVVVINVHVNIINIQDGDQAVPILVA